MSVLRHQLGTYERLSALKLDVQLRHVKRLAWDRTSGPCRVKTARGIYRVCWRRRECRHRDRFWLTVNGNALDHAVLEWCKLFDKKRVSTTGAISNPAQLQCSAQFRLQRELPAEGFEPPTP